MIKSALLKPAPTGAGWQLMLEYDDHPGQLYAFRNRVEAVNFLTAIMPDPERLPCGCLGSCDPYAHDTAWDWDGRPSVDDERVLCAYCGALCDQKDADDEGEYICPDCATENANIERRVQDDLEGRD